MAKQKDPYREGERHGRPDPAWNEQQWKLFKKGWEDHNRWRVAHDMGALSPPKSPWEIAEAREQRRRAGGYLLILIAGIGALLVAVVALSMINSPLPPTPAAPHP